MKTKTVFLFFLLLPVFISAETVYKTRDTEGNIIFSDIPSIDAEVIEIKEPQSLNIPEVKQSAYRRAEKLSPEETNYTIFKIINPVNDSTIHSNEGIVNVSLEIAPTLAEKHKIIYSMNGKEIKSGNTLKLTLTDIDRGSHTITAAVKNEKNELIKQSGETIFHVRKDSVLFKNRANNGSAISPVNPPISP